MNSSKDNSQSKHKYIKSYFSRLNEILSVINYQEISVFIDLLEIVSDKNKMLYFAGNGGSAATASHYVNDFMIGLGNSTKKFRAISLGDNHAVMSCIANDYGYSEVFSRQLKHQIVEGDMLICISASGNSENLIKAVECAKENNALTVCITAFDGGKLKQIADHSVHVATKKGEYGPAEDAHMILDHLISGYFMSLNKA